MKIDRVTMTEDWQPTDRIKQECEDRFGQEIEIEHEVEQFKDYYLSTGGAYANWNVKFRAWCRQNAKWNRERDTRINTETVSEQRNRMSGIIDQRNGKTNTEEKHNKIRIQRKHIKSVS